MSILKRQVFLISLWVGIFCRSAFPQISAFPVSGGGAGGSSGSYSVAPATYTVGTYFIAPGGGAAPNATEANVQGTATIAGAISNFSVTLSAAPGAGNTAAFTWRKAGVNQSVTCSITGASAKTCTDVSHTFNVAVNDLIDVQMVISVGSLTTSGIVLQWGTPGTAGANGTNGAITTLQVNGVGVTTPTTTNLQDSTTPNSGLSVAFTNPSAGNVKATITGTPALPASAITSGILPTANGGTGVASGFSMDGSGNLTITGSMKTGGGPAITGTGIAGITEATGQACVSGADCLIADSATHALLLSNNNGTARPVASVSGALTLNDCLKAGANNTVVDAGAACGAGGGGGSAINTQTDGVTNNTGIAALNFQTSSDAVPTVTPSGTTSSLSYSIPTTKWATRDQVQSGADLNCSPVSGSSTTYTCNPTHPLPAYADNMSMNIKFDVNCASGAKTLNVSSLGAKRLFGPDGTTDLTTSQCLATQQNHAIYNGAIDSGNGGWKVQVSSTPATITPVSGLLMPYGPPNLGLDTAAQSANVVRYFQVYIPSPGLVLNAVNVWGGAAGNVGNMAFGIYDSSCTKVAQSGTVAGPGANQSLAFSFSSVSLLGGTYYVALATDSASTALRVAQSEGNASGYFAFLINTGKIATTYPLFLGSNVSSTSGGVTTLPSSCGTRTAPNGGDMFTPFFSLE